MTLSVSFAEASDAFDVRMVDDATVLHSPFSDQSSVIPVSFGVYGRLTVVSGDDPYEGAYDVVPDWDGQTLPTGLRYCASDIDVHPIPIASVSNQSGGKTVTVGG